MKHVLTILVLSLVGVAACVDSAPTASEPTASQSSQTSELSEAPEAANGGATTEAVTCTKIWECDQICGRFVNGVLIRFSTNVLHQECSDGSDTVVKTDPCGEDCF
jgi:hypothetical protein